MGSLQCRVANAAWLRVQVRFSRAVSPIVLLGLQAVHHVSKRNCRRRWVGRDGGAWPNCGGVPDTANASGADPLAHESCCTRTGGEARGDNVLLRRLPLGGLVVTTHGSGVVARRGALLHRHRRTYFARRCGLGNARRSFGCGRIRIFRPGLRRRCGGGNTGGGNHGRRSRRGNQYFYDVAGNSGRGCRLDRRNRQWHLGLFAEGTARSDRQLEQTIELIVASGIGQQVSVLPVRIFCARRLYERTSNLGDIRNPSKRIARHQQAGDGQHSECNSHDHRHRDNPQCGKHETCRAVAPDARMSGGLLRNAPPLTPAITESRVKVNRQFVPSVHNRHERAVADTG